MKYGFSKMGDLSYERNLFACSANLAVNQDEKLEQSLKE